MPGPYALGPYQDGLEEIAFHMLEERHRKDNYLRPVYNSTPSIATLVYVSKAESAMKATLGLADLPRPSSGSSNSVLDRLEEQKYLRYCAASRSRTKSTPKKEENEGFMYRFGTWLFGEDDFP